MKFKDYLDSLNKLAAERPETLEMDVVYSRDDEGNGYQRVCYSPSVGEHDGEYHGEFTSEAAIKSEPEEYGYDSFEDFEPNSVCIN